MNKALKFALIAAGVVIVLLAATGLWVSSKLSGDNLARTINSLTAGLPVKVEIGQAGLDVGEWMKLQPALRIENYKVANAPGFQSPTVVAGKLLRVKVALKPLLDGRLEVQELELDAPEIDIERNAQGQSNVQALLQAARTKQASAPASAESSGEGSIQTVAVESVVLTNGVLRLRDAGRPALGTETALSNISIRASDLELTKASALEFSANLLGGRKSTIHFKGNGGPYTAQSIPVSGRLELRLSPGEVPADLRKKVYSEWLREPGEASQVDGNLNIAGDMLGQLKGDGDLTFKGFQIGKERGKTLPLEGTAKFKVTRSTVSSGHPSWAIATDGAKMNLGKGTWNGSLKASGVGERIEVESGGSVQGVPINEFLGVFSPSSSGLVYGTLVMPRYELKIAGETPEQLEASATGSGHMDVKDGRIPKLDVLAKIQGAVGSFVGGGKAGDDTNFSTMALDYNIADRKVNLSNVAMTGPGVSMNGGGTVTFDQALNLKLNAVVAGGVGSALGKLDKTGKDELVVPTTVTGSTSNPKVAVQVKSVLMDRGVSAATSLLDRFLGGKKK